MAHINQSSKNIKYHQKTCLFTCLLVQSRLYHQHQITNTIQLYHTQFRNGKNLSDYRWQVRQVNEPLIASRNTFFCFKSFRYDLPTGRVCKTGFPILPRFFLVYWGLRQATVYNGKGLLQWCLIIVICCIIVVKSSLSLPKRSGPGYYGSVFVHKLYLINSWIYLHLPSDPSVPRACPCCGCFHAAVSGWGQIPWAPDRPQRKLRWSPPSPRGRQTSPGHGRSCRTAVLRSSRHVGEMWQYMTIYDNNMTI